MVTEEDLARWRLRTQRLVRRTQHRDGVPGLIADRTVVRTHVLRTTWHYALVEDVGWLLDLTAPRRRARGAAYGGV